MPTDDPARFGGENDSHVNPFAAPRAADEPGDAAPAGELTLNPWVSILNQPTATIRQVVDHNPNYGVPVLCALLGLCGFLGMNDGPESDHIGLLIVFVASVIGGPLFGFLFVYVYSAVLTVSARMIGGKGTHAETRAAYAWSAVPTIYTIPITLVSAVANSEEFFERVGDSLMAVDGVTAGTNLVVAIWSFILSLYTVAEVNRFSKLSAFGAMILAGLLIFAALLVVGGVVFAVMASAGVGIFDLAVD